MDQIRTEYQQFALGEVATGSIDPEAREVDAEIAAQVERDVLGDRFDIDVIDGVVLPCGCIDGRCPHDGEAFNAVPNAAGGTLTLLVGELLTNRANIASNAENSEEALASLIVYLKQVGKGDQIGGHTGPAHGSDTASGCGANDALLPIMSQIAEKEDVIKGVVASLGVSTHGFSEIAAQARGLAATSEYFAAGAVNARTLSDASLEGNCPELQGAHNEILIRLNTKEGTTIDRRALKDAYGDDYQIFNVDVWALKAAAETLASTEEEAETKLSAMVAYQVATALQLCGPSMRVIVR